MQEMEGNPRETKISREKHPNFSHLRSDEGQCPPDQQHYTQGSGFSRTALDEVHPNSPLTALGSYKHNSGSLQNSQLETPFPFLG